VTAVNDVITPERLSRTGLLSGIRGPADLRCLTAQQLAELAAEIREFLVSSVSAVGGHLGANLGAVELTVALHRVFDSPKDPVLFDIGHQAYVHKILTGRQHLFGTLRRRGGLSGYPSRAESRHDLVENSHASTGLAYADGLAKAFELRGETDRRVAVVIGDGALTGGMCWEALNNIGASRRPIVIVLNDNQRFYDPTVGSLATHLRELRAASTGDARSLFEHLDLVYLGPVDGHDTVAVESALSAARAVGRPAIVHCVTTKGKGYPPAEQDEADRMHAVGVIDPATGRPLAAPTPSWTSVFEDEIAAIARRRPDVVGITAAMREPVGLGRFAAEFPTRVFDVGMAEQHAVTSAAGLAMGGMHPVVAVYATFLNRAFDQVLMDVALHRLPVTFVLDRAGITGPDGPTHHGMWDLSMLAMVPGLRVAGRRRADGDPFSQGGGRRGRAGVRPDRRGGRPATRRSRRAVGRGRPHRVDLPDDRGETPCRGHRGHRRGPPLGAAGRPGVGGHGRRVPGRPHRRARASAGWRRNRAGAGVRRRRYRRAGPVAGHSARVPRPGHTGGTGTGVRPGRARHHRHRLPGAWSVTPVSLNMPALPPPVLAPRRRTRQLRVGSVGVGSEYPISVQSMTTTLTADVNATLQQIAELTAAGCDIVRVACPSQDDADALPAIARKSQIPVIADIHFQPKYVFAAIEAGCAAVRVNPGNIKKFDDKIKEIAAAAKDHGTPIRIGVNAGSLDPRLLAKYGKATPEALVESALWEAGLFAEHDFHDVKISVKHNDPVVMIRAYELLAERSDYPLHLGVTEAGPAFQGTIKSAVAFGALLRQGIGDTIRVSLSAPPVEEVKVGAQILQSLNLRPRKLEIVSCPSCGRAQVDVYKLAEEVTAGLEGMEVPLRVAVMGCVVNGPGEAREADLGVASGNGKGQIFVRGKVIKTVPEHRIVETLIEEAMRIAEEPDGSG
jgi:(E)-4-hydroxy-3-methylbut-2-enyl-diphosphate synthase